MQLSRTLYSFSYEPGPLPEVGNGQNVELNGCGAGLIGVVNRAIALIENFRNKAGGATQTRPACEQSSIASLCPSRALSLGRALVAPLLLFGKPSSTPGHPVFWFDPSGYGARFGPARLSPDGQTTAHTLHVLRGYRNVLAADESRIPKGTREMVCSRKSFWSDCQLRYAIRWTAGKSAPPL